MTDKALKVVAENPAAAVPAPLRPPVFTADAPQPAFASPQARVLAELALHGSAGTPLCIGLFGPAGSGKSTLLRATLDGAAALAAAAKEAGLATPFLGGTAVVPVTLRPGVDPASAIADAVHDRLAALDPTVVSEAGLAVGDPRAAAEAARDRLDEERHRLDRERRTFDELAGRQGRLVETVLFEPSGSQVDAYARANRGRIDRALRAFGFGGDTVRAYKELVRDEAEGGGRGVGWVAALWAYRGQVRLLVVAAAFLLLFWALGLLIDNQGSLLDGLRGSNEKVIPVADWLAAHAGWLPPARQVAGLAVLVALVLNLLRAVRFAQPIMRGARLLRGDLETRRRDLDGLVAHQAQRVETLARSVEDVGARAAEAETRLTRAAATPRPEGLARRLASPTPGDAAQAFFGALSRTLDARQDERPASGPITRILLGLDGLETLPARDAAAALDAAHALLGQPGIVTLVTLDRTHLAAGIADTDPALATATLDRVVQVPVAVDRDEQARSLVGSLLAPSAPDAAPPAPDATHSALDKAWLPKEAAVLEALAPLAGSTPRAVKRFVNIYRVARADPAMQGAGGQDHAALALGLVLQAQGLRPELPAGDGPLDGDIQAARHAVSTALGTAIEIGRDNRGFAVARRYTAV